MVQCFVFAGMVYYCWINHILLLNTLAELIILMNNMETKEIFIRLNSYVIVLCPFSFSSIPGRGLTFDVSFWCPHSLNGLALPLPISQLSYQFRIYAKSTCIHALNAMKIFHYIHGWKSPTRMVSDMDAMCSCIFNFCDARMRIAITCVVPRGYFRGPP